MIREFIRRVYAIAYPGMRPVTEAEFSRLKLAEARLRVAVGLMDRSFRVDIPASLTGLPYASVASQDHFRAMHQFIETCREDGHAGNRRY